MRKMLSVFLICVVVVLIGVLVLIRYLEATSVFYPSAIMNNGPSQLGLAFDDVYFKTSDGVVLNGWFIKQPGARATIIFAHGNAGNMGDRLFKVKFFHDMGLNVFMFDYRGFGKSQGKPSERGVYLDAQAAYDYLKTRTDLSDAIIGYGASLGGAVMIDLALHRHLSILVVDSSFTSAKDMAHRIYPYLPTWMMSIKFNSIDKVKHIDIPKFFIHSKEDRTVPYSIGHRLFEAAAKPKEFVQIHGGHNDAGIVSNPSAIAQLTQFLKKNNCI